MCGNPNVPKKRKRPTTTPNITFVEYYRNNCAMIESRRLAVSITGHKSQVIRSLRFQSFVLISLFRGCQQAFFSVELDWMMF